VLCANLGLMQLGGGAALGNRRYLEGGTLVRGGRRRLCAW
jgi:hypothetical protein